MCYMYEYIYIHIYICMCICYQPFNAKALRPCWLLEPYFAPEPRSFGPERKNATYVGYVGYV